MMAKKWKPAIFGVCAIVMFSEAYAQIDYDKTVDRLGIQGAQAYFSVSEGLSLNCLYGNIYLSLSSPEGRVAYAQILSAKLAGKKLSRVDYEQSADSQCSLSLVEMQN